MTSKSKSRFLENLTKRYGGSLRKLGRSQSLYEIGDGLARIYIRYSKVHPGDRTFYGLREEDLQRLEGYPSILCFLWDGQTEPLLIPFLEYEDVFQSTSPARDGQYKAQIYFHDEGTELYIARAGRFNVEGYFGWSELETLIDSAEFEAMPEFSHSQIQTFLGGIGISKGYDVWIPQTDRGKLDWSMTDRFRCCNVLPHGFDPIEDILREIDVIWIHRGSSQLRALFEVEHSTPVYSGLLRFNDIHLLVPNLRPRFSVVANDIRRSTFVRQLRRPTFQASGLSELCTFLEYANVFGWHKRVRAKG
jgi:hypothetical protein